MLILNNSEEEKGNPEKDISYKFLEFDNSNALSSRKQYSTKTSKILKRKDYSHSENNTYFVR